MEVEVEQFFGRNASRFFEDIRPELNLSQYQIVCRDNWHCLLTKHYLYLNDLSEEFNVLYCMDCDN